MPVHACSGRSGFAVLLMVLWTIAGATRHVGPFADWKPRRPRSTPLSAVQLERTVSLVRSHGAILLSRAIDDQDAVSIKSVHVGDFYAAVETPDGSTRAAILPFELSDAIAAAMRRKPQTIVHIAAAALGGNTSLCGVSALVIGVGHKQKTDLWEHVDESGATEPELYVLLPLHDYGTNGNVSNISYGAWELQQETDTSPPVQVPRRNPPWRAPARLASRPGDAIIAVSKASLRRLPNTSDIAVVTVVLRFVKDPDACARLDASLR
jgi:hypothetical protein